MRPFVAGSCAVIIFVAGWLIGNCRIPELFTEFDPTPVSVPLPYDPDAPPPVRETASDVVAIESLAEVNTARAKRHLPAFVYDDGLATGAAKCATYRAMHLIDGHTKNDFSFLPANVWADGAGCAAWYDMYGWGACFTYENYRYAGAAWARGSDGKRYMHLFVKTRLPHQKIDDKTQMVVCPHCGHLKWQASWCPHCHKWSALDLTGLPRIDWRIKTN